MSLSGIGTIKDKLALIIYDTWQSIRNKGQSIMKFTNIHVKLFAVLSNCGITFIKTTLLLIQTFYHNLARCINKTPAVAHVYRRSCLMESRDLLKKRLL